MLKKFIVTTTIVFTLSIFGYFSPPWFFCLRPSATVQDAEFSKIALLNEAKKGLLILDQDSNGVEQYLKNHPQCCTVEPNKPNHKAILPFGDSGVMVHLIYKMSKPPSRDFDGWYYESFVYITSCGKVYQNYGQMISPQQAKKS